MRSTLFTALLLLAGITSCVYNTDVPLNEPTYQIVLQSEGNGSLSITSSMITVEPGDTITIIAYGDTNTVFDKWTHGPSITPLHNLTDTIISFTAHGDDTLTACFQIKKYAVYILPSNTSYGQVTPNTLQTASHGGSITVKGESLRGCQFQSTKWTNPAGFTITNLVNDSFTISNINQSCTLTANFEIVPPVSGVVYVDSAANTNGVKDGSSWFDAFTSLALACSLSAEGSTFWVTKGTYTPIDEFVGDENNFITLDTGDKLYGGFTGFESSFVERGNSWKSHSTVISGEIGATNSKYLIVGMAGCYIDGITVRDAYASPGAVFLYQGNCKVTNSILRNNNGHGLHVLGANSIIDRCIFTENDAGVGGVGASIYVQKDNVLVENCIFYNNEADNGAPAVFSDYKCLIVFCTIANNISNGNNTSSGIRGAAGTEVINSVLYGNVSNGGSGDQVQISISDVVFHCAITDKNGKGLEAVTTETNNIKNPNLVVRFLNAGNPEGTDGYFFTADDGFNLTTSSTDLVDKGYYKTLSDPFSMALKDILVNNRGPVPVVDIGAYEY